jgi:hypothetical protein
MKGDRQKYEFAWQTGELVVRKADKQAERQVKRRGSDRQTNGKKEV